MLSRRDTARGLTWARIGHDQALRANLPGPSPRQSSSVTPTPERGATTISAATRPGDCTLDANHRHGPPDRCRLPEDTWLFAGGPALYVSVAVLRCCIETMRMPWDPDSRRLSPGTVQVCVWSQGGCDCLDLVGSVAGVVGAGAADPFCDGAEALSRRCGVTKAPGHGMRRGGRSGALFPPPVLDVEPRGRGQVIAELAGLALAPAGQAVWWPGWAGREVDGGPRCRGPGPAQDRRAWWVPVADAVSVTQLLLGLAEEWAQRAARWTRRWPGG